MKMSMTFSVRISLLTLAVVMHFSASAEIHYGCCDNIKSPKEIKNIKDCYKQEKRMGCYHEVYVIKTENETFCVKPTPPWLKDQIENKKLDCPPEISHKLRRFLLLDVDDLKWLK